MERTTPGRGDGAALDRRRRRLLLAGYLVRSLAAAALLTALYFVAPLDSGFGLFTVTLLVLGLVLFGWLIVWQTLTIAHAQYPRLRAIEALATAVPLLLVLFAATYILLATEAPQSFSQPLSRLDALYFTVTVFATVGFGDIVPTTETARALVTGQMVADLIVVGIIAKVLFGAVAIGMASRDEAPVPPKDEP